MLLERGAEVETLARLIAELRDGNPSVAVIEGAAGLGKSRLLAEAREQAATAGVAVHTASAREIEGDFGFGVVGQLLSGVVRSDPERLLTGAAASVGAILAPELVGAKNPAEAPTFAALHGLHRLVAQIAEEQPQLMVIDDLHWCDAASLRFLAYLRNRVDGLPVLLLCSTRPHERSSDAAALHGLLDDPKTVWLRPRPLSLAASTTLIEAALTQAADPAFAASCHRITSGNPLLLEQLVAALDAEGVTPDVARLPLLDDIGPAAVSSSVLLRLGRLGDDAIRAAQALAVLGDDAELAHVIDLAGLDVETGARAVAALARTDLVRADPRLGFVHPLVAAAVYRDLPVGERELRHLRAAELIARAGAPAEQVAGHLLRAPARADPDVVDQLVRAAAVASDKGAGASSAAYLERAMAEPPAAHQRADVAWALGRAQASGHGPAAVANLRSVYEARTGAEERGEDRGGGARRGRRGARQRAHVHRGGRRGHRGAALGGGGSSGAVGRALAARSLRAVRRPVRHRRSGRAGPARSAPGSGRRLGHRRADDGRAGRRALDAHRWAV